MYDCIFVHYPRLGYTTVPRSSLAGVCRNYINIATEALFVQYLTTLHFEGGRKERGRERE